MEGAIPRLRADLEIISTYYHGERALLIKDSLGLIHDPVILQGEALNLLGLIDGKRNIRDIQLEIIRQRGGIFVSSESIEKLLSELEAAFLLEGENYSQAKDKLITEYSLLEKRLPSHAGLSYPAGREELSEYLNSLLSLGEEQSPALESKKISALIAPHIDLEAGKRVYAKAYQAIKNSSPKKVFLLGTGHHLMESYFSLTEKDFETPLGRVKTDRDLVRKLKRAGGKATSSHDIAHYKEHSLEFELIFLQHLFGNSFSLVPCLCGSLEKELERVSRPAEIPEVDSFLRTLKDDLKAHGSKTLVVAGVDFSHIGPKFGHSQRASSLLLDAKKHDRLLIEAISKGDVEAFWLESRKVKDRYNVCGFSTLASLLEIFPGAQGYLLDYEFWREEPTQSAVSFAAIALESK